MLIQRCGKQPIFFLASVARRSATLSISPPIKLTKLVVTRTWMGPTLPYPKARDRNLSSSPLFLCSHLRKKHSAASALSPASSPPQLLPDEISTPAPPLESAPPQLLPAERAAPAPSRRARHPCPSFFPSSAPPQLLPSERAAPASSRRARRFLPI
jgi:hypothetical protein